MAERDARSRLTAAESHVPRYYFDTDDGDFRHDDETGQEMPDAEAARRAALEVLPGMARDKLPYDDRHSFSVRVRDASGTVLYNAELNLVGEWQAEPPGNQSSSPRK